MRYLITGGAGFIGSHLAEHLVAAGHHVTALDDLSTGSLANIQRLAASRRFSLRIGSVLDAREVEQAVSKADAVFHLAAAVGVRLVLKNPIRTIETNVRGTQLILEAARGRKTLVASTSEVYGKNPHPPFCEEDDLILGPPTKARWSYARSKAVAESYATSYHRQRRCLAVIARLFNVVGARQSGAYGMVLPRFVDQALRGRPITVYGDGAQTRCFLHVRDCVRALSALMDEPLANGGTFNVGDTNEVSINELAGLVKRSTRSLSPIVHVPYERAYGADFEDMHRRAPDTTKIARLIGFRPQLTLSDAVQDVIERQLACASNDCESTPSPA